MANEIAAVGVPSPPPLSDQYHNARNKYALFSALLLAWSFLGIQIDIKSLFANVNVSLPTPEKLPILLTVLVLYYAYRICIEWNQCDGIRRSYRSSRVDFTVTHSIGLASILAYGVQQTIPDVGQMVIDRAPSLLILSVLVLFVPYGQIVQHFISKGFYKDRWYGRTPITRVLTSSSCWSVAQAFYIQYAVAAVMGSQVLEKGNSTYPVILIASLLLFSLGYGLHEIPFSRVGLSRLIYKKNPKLTGSATSESHSHINQQVL